MMGREVIDIEALLIRAYREKRVHRLPGAAAALGMMGPVGGGCALGAGEKVDTSSFAARMAARERVAFERLRGASDALLDLHDAVLALPDFHLERTGEDLEAIAVWDAETARRMGQRIESDPGGHWIVKAGPRFRPREGEADYVELGPRRRVEPIVAAALVMIAGQDACRPHVSDVVVTGRRPVYRGGDKLAIGHVPVYETPLPTVIEERAAYAVWHVALGMLAGWCRDHFAAAEVTGPAAPAVPWERIVRLHESPETAPSPPPSTAPRRVPRRTRKGSA